MRNVVILFVGLFLLTALFYWLFGNENLGLSINGQVYNGIALVLAEVGGTLVSLVVGVVLVFLLGMAFAGVSLLIVIELLFFLGLVFAPVLLPGLLIVGVFLLLFNRKSDKEPETAKS